MPVGTQGRWYDDAEAQAVAADKGLTVLSAAATTEYTFSSEGFDTLMATLATHELYATSLTGANNDLVFVAKDDNTSALTITYVDPAANDAALAVSISTNDITVSLATGSGGAITSTASQVLAAVNSDADSSGKVQAFLKGSDTGAGVVTAMSQQAIAGWTGTSPTLDVSLETSVDGSNWYASGTAFTQATAVGAPQGRAFAGLGTQCRWKVIVGGTNPVVAFDIDASGK